MLLKRPSSIIGKVQPIPEIPEALADPFYRQTLSARTVAIDRSGGDLPLVAGPKMIQFRVRKVY